MESEALTLERPATEPETWPEPGADRPPSAVAKALGLLEAFVDAPAWLGVTEISRRAGIAKSSAFRLLTTLEELGYVIRRDKRYALGDRIFELGCQTAFCRPRSLRDIAVPHLAELFLATHATVHLAVLDGTDVLYLEKIHGRNGVKSPSHVGSRIPAAATALGMAMLAFGCSDLVDAVVRRGLPRRTVYSVTNPDHLRAELAAIRSCGYALERERSSLGVACLAAPVRVDTSPVAAISLCVPSGTTDLEGKAGVVCATAEQIARELRVRRGRHA